MTVGELKQRIKYMDDDVEVLVAPNNLINPTHPVIQADLQLPFNPPTKIDDNHYQMELLQPMIPHLIITYQAPAK